MMRFAVLSSLGINFNELEEVEYDAALGNGGLGRLALLYGIGRQHEPAVMGYGVRYSQGDIPPAFSERFPKRRRRRLAEKQRPWSLRKESEQVLVRFGRSTVRAIRMMFRFSATIQKT